MTLNDDFAEAIELIAARTNFFRETDAVRVAEIVSAIRSGIATDAEPDPGPEPDVVTNVASG